MASEHSAASNPVKSRYSDYTEDRKDHVFGPDVNWSRSTKSGFKGLIENPYV
jgi:hypothetical protein